MNPHDLLTPPARQLLSMQARLRQAPMQALSPAQARQRYTLAAGVLELPAPALARVQEISLRSRDGQALRARLYAPSAEPLPVLLFLHGGGFVVGSVDTHDGLCRDLSQAAHCAVVSLDYRLAPEHRFPTAVHDAWDALLTLRAQAASWGLDPTRLAVGGDSAGGTLAAVCALMARDAGLPLALQLLFYPGCAAAPQSRSHQLFGQGFLLETAQLNWFFSHYIDPSARRDWRFAPLEADDLEQVAPLWLGLAECDPLVDEGLDYADRLRAAGVAVELELFRGVVHEFVKLGRLLPEARLARQAAAQALRQAFQTAPDLFPASPTAFHRAGPG